MIKNNLVLLLSSVLFLTACNPQHDPQYVPEDSTAESTSPNSANPEWQMDSLNEVWDGKMSFQYDKEEETVYVFLDSAGMRADVRDALDSDRSTDSWNYENLRDTLVIIATDLRGYLEANERMVVVNPLDETLVLLEITEDGVIYEYVDIMK